jgi:hypothetical protein
MSSRDLTLEGQDTKVFPASDGDRIVSLNLTTESGQAMLDGSKIQTQLSSENSGDRLFFMVPKSPNLLSHLEGERNSATDCVDRGS